MTPGRHRMNRCIPHRQPAAQCSCRPALKRSVQIAVAIHMEMTRHKLLSSSGSNANLIRESDSNPCWVGRGRLMKVISATMAALLLFLCPVDSKQTQEKVRVIAQSIERFPATAFPQLPRNLVSRLQARGCTIPQTDLEPRPNNIISGKFARRGQTSWAVLCSKGGVSSILVFWDSATKSPAELAKSRDDAYWLGNAAEGFHYYRHIMVADKDYILVHYKEYDRSNKPPPPITHDGIDDGFLEKGSDVFYYYRGKWLELPGAD